MRWLLKWLVWIFLNFFVFDGCFHCFRKIYFRIPVCFYFRLKIMSLCLFMRWKRLCLRILFMIEWKKTKMFWTLDKFWNDCFSLNMMRKSFVWFCSLIKYIIFFVIFYELYSNFLFEFVMMRNKCLKKIDQMNRIFRAPIKTKSKKNKIKNVICRENLNVVTKI